VTVSAPERGRSYLELPSEQLTASTPAQFSQLLNRVMTAADLRASEVAIKAKIPRSQAYSMVSGNRTALPSKPEQVRAFVKACGLNPVQATTVIDLWAKLDQQARELAVEVARPPDHGAGVPAPSFTIDEDDPPGPAAAVLQIKPFRFRLGSRPSRPSRPSSAVFYRPEAFVDLIILILDDDARTRRALALLIPLVLAFVVIVAIFTAWAVLQPDHASWIGGIFASGFLFPISTMIRRATRIRR
jgi:hypothetical protein